jgi:predicted acylesterase/phospholipase RssA
MKVLSISGGSTKISGLAAASITCMRNGYCPNIIGGISAGAILALPLAMRKFDIIEREVLNFNLNSIFEHKPIGKWGGFSFRSILSILKGERGLTNMNPLKLKLQELIPYEEWKIWQIETKIKVYVGTVDFVTGKRHMHLLNKLSYWEVIDLIVASASVPLYVGPTSFRGMQLLDGGVRMHNPGNWFLSKMNNISEMISIYSRPQKIILDDNWKPKNAIQILDRYVTIANIEISKKDELLETLLAQKNGTKLTQIFLPSVMKGLWDTDKQRIKQLWLEGLKAFKNT